MKKAIKILLYTLLGVVLLISAFLAFFVMRYERVGKSITDLKLKSAKDSASFYHFEFAKDSTSEWALLPQPKKLTSQKGEFRWPAKWNVVADLPKASTWVNNLLGAENVIGSSTATIRFVHDANLPAEGYRVNIQPDRVEVFSSQPAGAYYGVVTLHHLRKQFPHAIKCVQVDDAPDLAIRGLLYDVSRDKVPQLSTIKELVDKLSLLKYNHLELYVEGFSFAYPSFKELWEGTETPITPEEIQELDAYCKERFIELVPNQNSLGHMQAWLATDKYKHLAECPEGYELLPMQKMKTTLDPTKEESIKLVGQMMKDILPNFSSKKFNANLDEPFELGHCNSAELAKEIGVGQLYLEFVLKVYALAKEEQKEFWMWGDIAGKHPEILSKLPKDITMLEWGYEEEHPFDLNIRRIKEAGLEFMVCPGTSSWMSLTGRTDNMLGNIENAVLNGVKNGARGMLLTDWGDMGHWQHQPVSYPGYVYAGAISWNSTSSRNLSIDHYLNTYLFNNQKVAEVIMEMGRSYHFEESHLPNMSHNFMTYQIGMLDPVLEKTIYDAIEKKFPELVEDNMLEAIQDRFNNRKSFDVAELNEQLIGLETTVKEIISDNKVEGIGSNADIQLVAYQLQNGIEMARLATEIRNYGIQKNNWTSEERITYLEGMRQRSKAMQDEFRRLWLLKNKEGGLDRSMRAFQNIDTQIIKQIEIEQGTSFSKKIARFKDKIIGGGANWFLLD